MEHPFVKKLPWKNSARKNLGYLYAISHGANVIWDFDENVMLKFWLKDAGPDQSLEIDTFVDKDSMASASNYAINVLMQIQSY